MNPFFSSIYPIRAFVHLGLHIWLGILGPATLTYLETDRHRKAVIIHDIIHIQLL